MIADHTIADHMAAAILMKAQLQAQSSGQKAALQLNTKSLANLIFDEFEDLALSGPHLKSAVKALRECGLAKSSPEQFEEQFHRIEFGALGVAITTAHKEGIKVMEAVEGLRINDANLNNFPYFKAFNDHRLIERYHDFGNDWLRGRIESLMFELSANADPIIEGAPPNVSIPDIADRSDGLSLSEETRERLLIEVEQTIRAVEASSVGNVEKAQAMALLTAINALAEAPEPPTDLIWRLVSRANELAGIAAFFISIIALFK